MKKDVNVLKIHYVNLPIAIEKIEVLDDDGTIELYINKSIIEEKEDKE